MGTDAGTRPWRQIGWDGIGFTAPRAWQPARIGRRHLAFNDDTGPVMEIKWSRPGARQNARRIIAQLAGQRRGALAACPVPPPWAKALAGRQASAFSWSTATAQAEGAALCLAAGTWVLVQFFGSPDRSSSATLLASLDDGPATGPRLWSIYDIQARLDRSFELRRWDFSAGAFRLELSAQGRQLTLYRLAPASVIMATTDLDRLARQLLAGTRPLRQDNAGGQWTVYQAPAGRWLRRVMGLAPLVERLRLWHLAGANRILGVRLKGPGVGDGQKPDPSQRFPIRVIVSSV